MSPHDASVEGSSANELACTPCRNRKLKCDRIKPACTRCARIKSDCIYPESRRKPAFKRKNVRELEARLAQVEGLLKQTGADKAPADGKDADEVFDFDFADFAPTTEDVFLQGLDYTFPSIGPEDDPMLSLPETDASSMPFTTADGSQVPGASFSGELLGLGMSESLPPFEVTEELTRVFLERQQLFIPVIHPARYLQAYYSAPHMRPPMSLQYAMWALASIGHDRYGQLHDVFYARARQYAEADELKGHGEHFITVQHAQAWSLICTDEAKCMLFTRAAMSSARAVRLAHMMGLHRLDATQEDLPQTLMPPKDWAELEERRRTFWGIFCLDSHCSVSTGWPHLIDPTEITTHLPTSESAFFAGQAVETCRLDEAFRGSTYSSFAGAVLVCHLFNQILKHIHRPKPNDNAQNYEYGEYWERHRDIDNQISSAFMFLPEHFRLPENYRDPTAVHTSLNYHAALICLHLAALDKIDAHNLPDHAQRTSEGRLFTAAQEIVNIIKMTSHLRTNPRSPMAAIALYCAASVYIYQCKKTQSPKNIGNLEFIIAAMDAIGREHIITRAFLKQLLLDIERNDITQIRTSRTRPAVNGLPHVIAVGNHNIPLLMRSQISRHTELPTPLPGRLPLGNPKGDINLHPKCNINLNQMSDCGIGDGSPIRDNPLGSGSDASRREGGSPLSSAAAASGASNLSQEQIPFCTPSSHEHSPLWCPNDTTRPSNLTPPDAATRSQPPSQPVRADPFASFQRSPWAQLTRGFTNKPIPVRTGSPMVTTPISAQSRGPTLPGSPAIPVSRIAEPQHPSPYISPNLDRDFAPADVCMYGQLANEPALASGNSGDPWDISGQAESVDWDALGTTSADIVVADFPNSLHVDLNR